MPKIRTTLTIDQDVVARYQAMAELQGESLSSTVSAWLETSADSAQLLAQRIAQIKRSASPTKAAQRVLQSLQVVEEGFAQAITERKREGGGRPGVAGGARPPSPPSCNTGGKVPKTAKVTGS